MAITRTDVANRITAYLHHEITLEDLVAWAEQGIMDGEYEIRHQHPIRDVLARLGVADVRAFGLNWEDCEEMLRSLGFAVDVTVRAL